MRLEFARLLVGEAPRVAGGLLQQLRQAPGGAEVAEEGVDARQQLGGVAAHEPLYRALLGEREADQHVGVQVMGEGEFARVGDRVLRFTRVDILDRIRRARRRLYPLQRRGDGALQTLQDALLRAAGAHRDARGFELQRVARAHAAARIDHELRDARVGGGGSADAAPLGGVGERGGGDVGASRGELGLHGALVGDRVHAEPDAQPRGIGARQLELQPFGALRAEVVAGRQIERDHAQLAARADLLECRRPRRGRRRRSRPAGRAPRRGCMRARSSSHRTAFR